MCSQGTLYACMSKCVCVCFCVCVCVLCIMNDNLNTFSILHLFVLSHQITSVSSSCQRSQKPM